MNFTVVFNGQESFDLSYLLLFIPCPVWQHGKREIVNLHPENPNYRGGDLGVLLKKEEIGKKLAPGVKQAAIVVHGLGNGRQEDLRALEEELWAEGFRVSVVFFSGSV